MEEHEQSNLVKIGEAASILGVHPATLRRWHRDGFLKPTFLTNKRGGGTRMYSRSLIQKLTKSCI